MFVNSDKSKFLVQGHHESSAFSYCYPVTVQGEPLQDTSPSAVSSRDVQLSPSRSKPPSPLRLPPVADHHQAELPLVVIMLELSHRESVTRGVFLVPSRHRNVNLPLMFSRRPMHLLLWEAPFSFSFCSLPLC